MRYREGTWDKAIADNIMLNNEYGLPDRFESDDLVIDIGAHIGGFTKAAWDRGCRNLIAYEPHPMNYALLAENTEGLAGVAIHRAAVWKSGQQSTVLHAPWEFEDPQNTGGSDFLRTEGIAAYTVGLDTIIANRKVRFLKLDCEGAEFPILLTATQLGMVEELSMEFHEMASGRGDDPWKEIPEVAKVGDIPFTAEVLMTHLQVNGLTEVSTFYRHGEHQTSRLGAIHVRRKN